MEPILQFFRTLGQRRLALLVVTAILLLGLFVFVSARVSAPSFAPLYTDLSLDDSAHIVSELEKTGVPYELRAGGSQVLVPANQVLRQRLALAQTGLPSGGSIVGYEIFDRSDTMGTSSFVMNVNMLRALEGELARTISSLSQVESARVNLVVPRPELFSRDKQEPTASVVLKLRGVSELGKDQIGAVTHLVASAVPGLKPSKVTLVDSRGRLLAGGTDESDSTVSAARSDEYRIAYENHLRSTLESLLEKSLGMGKVKVTVSADINFDRVVTNSETFDPNGQVARSVQTGEEKEQASERAGGGAAGVAPNLPGAAAGQAGNGSTRLVDKTDETTNYEISKTVQNHVQEAGKVNRLSVAVLVDGNYTEDAGGKPVYTPRSEAERRQIETLVKSAVGFNAQRGDSVDVVNMRFIAPPEETATSSFAWLRQDFPGIIETLVYGAIAVLVILLVVRPLINRLIETAGAPAAGGTETPAFATAGLGGPGPRMTAGAPLVGAAEEEPSVDISRVTGRVKSSTYNRLNELVTQHPDEALNVLRQWAARRT